MKIANRVRETSNSIGTGNITLQGAVAGYQSFSEAFQNDDEIVYVIEEGVEVEIGLGILRAGGILERSQIWQAFAGGVKQVPAAPLNLSGQAQIYAAMTAELLANKADEGHNHDERYYTEGEIDGLMGMMSPLAHGHMIGDVVDLQSALDSKAGEGHNHDERYYTEGEIDGLMGMMSPLAHGHMIGDVADLQSALDSKADEGHNHDERYYTEGEIDDLMAGALSSQQVALMAETARLDAAILTKADEGHNHDERYYTEGEIDGLMAGALSSQQVALMAETARLDAAILTKADEGHNHDERYYTEGEIDGLIAGVLSGQQAALTAETARLDAAILTKADEGHNHDAFYYTQSEIDGLLSSATPAAHSHLAADVTDLQNILDTKLDLAGGNLAGTLNMAGQTVASPTFVDSREMRIDRGSVSGATALDMSAGDIQAFRPVGTTTLSFANWPAGASVRVIEITQGGSYSILWPSAIRWSTNTAPGLTTVANGVDLITLYSGNSGATVRAVHSWRQ